MIDDAYLSMGQKMIVSLRQNGVGTGFVRADAILPKGHTNTAVRLPRPGFIGADDSSRFNSIESDGAYSIKTSAWLFTYPLPKPIRSPYDCGLPTH